MMGRVFRTEELLPKITRQPVSAQCVRGQKAILNCHFTAPDSPAPIVTWFRNGDRLKTGDAAITVRTTKDSSELVRTVFIPRLPLSYSKRIVTHGQTCREKFIKKPQQILETYCNAKSKIHSIKWEFYLFWPL